MTRRILLGLMQVAVFCGVMAWQIEYARDSNGYIYGLFGVLAAIFATAIVIEIGDRWARLTGRAPPLTPQQRRDARQSPLRPRRLDADQGPR